MEQENMKSVCGLCQQGMVVKLIAVFVGILSIFFLVKTYGSLKENSFIGKDVYPQTTISVTGEGEVTAVPDIATFNFSITNEKLTVKEAQQNVTDIMGKVLSYLKEAGVDEKNIKTTGYNIYPRYEWKRVAGGFSSVSFPPSDQERVLVGYEVSQNVSVKLEDIDKAGEVLSGIGALEVTNVSGLNFEIDDADNLKREAREMAIEEAQIKAKELAKDLDVKLIRMVSYSSNDGNIYPMYAKSDMALGMGGGEVVSAEIPVGENEIKVTVYLTYEIK